MAQPVKLSDALLLDARITGQTMQRSMAGQIEFWATIGRALERLSTRAQIERLQQRAAIPLSEIVATINAPEGKLRLQTYLESRPFPRFSAHPTMPQTFIREEADGSTIIGRFSKGVFQPEAATA